MSLDPSRISNPFIQEHLAYVDQTEPPTAFHAWAAIACVSACMGRHVWIDGGLGKMFGNMYVVLVGPPATRKSTALKLAARIMQDATTVRMAPDDTGGQRQGLLHAFIDEDEVPDGEEPFDATALAADIECLADYHMSIGRVEDKHALFSLAEELGSFVGQNNTEFLRFLIKVYDGVRYDYKLRNHRAVLHEPLLALAGATTPDDLSLILPPEAMGQGFTSRIVFVYEPTKGKVVPPSQIHLDDSRRAGLESVYGNVWRNLYGAMEFTPEAIARLDRLYMHGCKIEDTRFIYYVERRDTHLRKLSMCLAAARGSMVISSEDVNDAHLMLHAAEARMPEALGEYGLSPVAVAKQKMLEYLRHAGEPVSESVLWAIMQRDMKLVDFHNSLSALCVADKVTAIDGVINGKKARMYVFNDMKSELASMDDSMIAELLGVK